MAHPATHPANLRSPGPPAPGAADPMRPRRFRIARVRRELADTFTLELEPLDGAGMHFKPGQFNMLYVFGIGEVPISISGDPADSSLLIHTTRAVGTVTNAMNRLKAGQSIGIRGPFGTHWPAEAAHGDDVLIVAGGIGLAPLRPLIHTVLAERDRFGKVLILYGARTPEDILFSRDLKTWRGRFDMSVHVTVDRATGSWNGHVGVVTRLIKMGGFDPGNTTAFVCGPEAMMRFCLTALSEKGVRPENMFISMERNMKCAVGVCGHCQWGGQFVCRDGPVFRFDQVADIFRVWEL